MKEEDEDPFGSLTRFSLIPSSQSNRLRSIPFARQHDHFPVDNTTTESQPEADKVFDQMPVRKMVKKRVLSGSEGFPVGTQTEDQAFDEMPLKKIRVFNVSEGTGGVDKVFGEMRVRKGVVEKKDRVLTGSEGSKRVSGDTVFDEMRMRKAVKIESLGNKAMVLTGSEGSKRVSADLGGNKVFGGMPMRKAVKIEPLGGKDRVLTCSEGSKRVDLGGDKVGMRNREVIMGIEVIDLEEDCELSVRKEKLKMGPDEVLDLDVNKTCDDLPIRNAEAEMGKNPSADVGKGGDLTTRNLIGKGGLNEGDEVCRDEIRGFLEKGIRGIDNGRHAPLIDDGNRRKYKENNERRELYTNLSPREKEIVKARNKVGEPCRDENRGSSEKGIEKIDRRDVVTYVGGSRKACGDEVCRDEIRGFGEKGIGGIDNGKRVSFKDDKNRQKDEGNGEGRELYEDLSHRNKEIAKALNKVGEPCKDANRGSSDEGIEEINRREENNVVSYVGGSRKACGDEPSGDVIRGCSSKETNTLKGNNNHREGKSQVRKLPSSFHTLAETGIRKTFVSHCERSKKDVEKNIRENENETSEPVSQKSKDLLQELLSSVGGETTNDQIMKNLLDGLDLIIGGEKETVDNASDGEVDILETAMKMGMVFPRPRWWPDEGFDDE